MEDCRKELGVERQLGLELTGAESLGCVELYHSPSSRDQIDSELRCQVSNFLILMNALQNVSRLEE